MAFRFMADVVLVLHFAFVIFVAVGGLLVLRRRHVMLLHLPAVAWGVLVECANWTCPLNPLEDWFRRLGGEVGGAYAKGFIDYYLSLIIRPEHLTRSFQITVGLSALAANLLIYAYIYSRSNTHSSRPA
jgi:Protein of Unknown function (DUF2784)